MNVVLCWRGTERQQKDRKSSPLSSRRQPPTFTNHLSGSIAAITLCNTHTITLAAVLTLETTLSSCLLFRFMTVCLQLAVANNQMSQMGFGVRLTDWGSVQITLWSAARRTLAGSSNPAEGNSSRDGRHVNSAEAKRCKQDLQDVMFPSAACYSEDTNKSTKFAADMNPHHFEDVVTHL